MNLRDGNNFVCGVIAGLMLTNHFAWAMLLWMALAAFNFVLAQRTVSKENER